MRISLQYLREEGSGPVALRLMPPAREGRIPMHFILMIDISDSMADGHKLEHVKHCMSLLLKFLTPADKVSIVTFGETSAILLKSVEATAAAVPGIEAKIRELRTDGCTNLSAGLASVREVLDAEVVGTAAQLPMKTGLFILTDGHANRGVSDSTALRGMLARLCETFLGLSCSLVAYGTDHNAGLLKGAAEDTHGSYSIVEDIEGAALAMGETLGDMMSCVAQNVIVELPAGTTGSGPHKVTAEGRLVLGDLYAGTEVVALLELPSAAAITVRGTAMPSLEPFSIAVEDRRLDTSRSVDIDLTRLRYRAADIFRRIREDAMTRLGTDSLRQEVEELRQALADEAFKGNAVGDMLRQEIPSMLAGLEMTASHRGGARLTTQLAQHEALWSLGRGTSQPISAAPPPSVYSRHVHWSGSVPRGGAAGSDDESDPVGIAGNESVTFLSPTASGAAHRTAIAMRTLSSTTPAPAAPRRQLPQHSPPASPSPIARATSSPN